MPACGTNVRRVPGAVSAWAAAACSDAGKGSGSLVVARPANWSWVEAAANRDAKISLPATVRSSASGRSIREA